MYFERTSEPLRVRLTSDKAKDGALVCHIDLLLGDMVMNCAKRSIFAVAAMLAANEVRAFVQPAGLTSLAGGSIATPACTSLQRNSRRWDKAQQMDAAGSGDGGNTSEKVGYGSLLVVITARE